MLHSVLVLSVIGAIQPAYLWDFESETIEGLRFHHASRTAEPGLVIDGSGSLLADSRESGETWNQFLQTDSEFFPLQANTAYTISLRYRAVEPMNRKAFYLLLRSETVGKVTGDRWGDWWEEFDQEVHTKNCILRTGDAPDYYLIIGIRDRGALVIDDLQIWDGEAPPNGIVQTGPFTLGKEFEEWKRSAEESGVAAWAKAAQTVIDPAGWRKWDGEYRDYLVNLRPDIVAYLNIPAVRELGLFRTSASMEYQELYEFDAEKHDVPWKEMVNRFRESGLAIDLDGEPIMDQTWAAGGYFACQAGEEWHRYYLNDLKNNLQRFNGLNQDNIGVVGAFKGHCAYCNGCQSRFRNYLAGKYSRETLQSWGIDDIETFDFLEFLLHHSLEGREALESPVVREYIKSYHLSQLRAWNDTARQVRAWTKGEEPFPVYGNIIGAMGPIPYAVMLCPWVDVISMEHYWPSADFYKPPRFHCAAWGYKVARSASAYPKPVFILNALEGEGGAAPFKTTTEFTLAEGLANGGYRVFSPGANIPRYDGKQPLDDPAIRELHERYSAFIRRNRGLFWGIKPAHRAAVVYSVPTHMFHRFPAIPGLEDLSEYKRFAAACLLMETLNIPYDVLVLPHPELMPDLRWEEKLEDCDLVVFPGVAVMSRNQARLLASYVEKGGRILAFGPFARYDENYNPIPDLFAAQDFSRLVVVDSWDLDLGNDLWDRKANPEIVTKVSRILETLYPPRERQVSGRIPRETVVNVWEDREKHFYAFHLLNYDWNPEEDRVNPVENLSFSVDVPENYRSYSPLMLSPDLDSPRRLGAMALDGRAQIEIPPLNVYAVVVWGDPDFIKAKTDYAEAMNLGIRMTKLGEEMPERWWETLRELWREGKHGEIRDMAQEWEEKAKAVESIFLQGKENK